MRPFRAAKDGTVRARFDRDEVDLLVQLSGEAGAIATAAAEGAGAAALDPAVLRLLPDAYPDDPDASAEFRRFTAAGIAERKALNARVVAETLAHGGAGTVEVRLDDAQAVAWLRAITDIRLVLAARLGIVQDGDDGDIHDASSALQRAVYDWLAGVQESLVLALDARR
ncbi:DUF2017 family protein [uncultured Leifsonia sp.]|uniref:DUF2017 family protein n=1 Tax=uncultured Leifsonia sp. TaxID=340359 RepID=UPI0028D2C4E6|nr:DUF2017 family protein [uncultured Leifsonia sp.]